MYYYALSDIHGYLELLKQNMNIIDLESNVENKVIFLGDYIDYGKESCQVLEYIFNLQRKYPSQVIVLRGNHEDMFLEWISNPEENVYWLNEDEDLITTRTFITKEQLENVLDMIKNKEKIQEISKVLAKMIKINHKDLIIWLKNLKYFYETENQIFVHAGIVEEEKEYWKIGSSNYLFTSKFPPQKGYFIKDIIAGHVGTKSIRKNNCSEVYWDGKSHYYIDGTTRESGLIPILKYDTKLKCYTSFKRKENDGNFIEYKVLGE
jgi:serine/threonine protein phosphatase 1